MTLHLVRHGRPAVDPARPAATWDLDPAGYDDVWALRDSGVLPGRAEAAAWFTSPEPKAVQTAQLLTDGTVGVVDDLCELERTGPYLAQDAYEDAVRRAVAEPTLAAVPGWETVEACRARLLRAVEPILAAHGDDPVVLVGHGTAWMLLAAELTGGTPGLERWSALGMPDVISVPPGLRSRR